MPERCTKELQFIGEVGWSKLWDSVMDMLNDAGVDAEMMSDDVKSVCLLKE